MIARSIKKFDPVTKKTCHLNPEELLGKILFLQGFRLNH